MFLTMKYYKSQRTGC